ncbi:hypothetical protein Hanom_Chr15g01383861 [Helianthus anomalus]
MLFVYILKRNGYSANLVKFVILCCYLEVCLCLLFFILVGVTSGISVSSSEDNMCYSNVMILGPTQSPNEGDLTLIAFLVLVYLLFVCCLICLK